MEITKADLLALKQCNDVVFRYIDGKSTIECIKRRSDDNPYEQKHIISCDTKTIIYDYSSKYGLTSRYTLVSAFAMTHSAQYDHVWQTVVSLIKAGDELTLFWKAGAGNNGHLKDAGLYCDHLEIIIKRKDKSMSFLIETEVNENNNVRMCRVQSNILA